MDSPLTMVFQDFYSWYAKLSGSLGPMDGIFWNSTRHHMLDAYAYDQVPIAYDLSKTPGMGLTTKVVCISRSSNFHHQGIPNCKV